MNSTKHKHFALSDSCRTAFLSEILPYQPKAKAGKLIKKCLDEYLFLILLSEEAFSSLEQKTISKFDPLVGENACQLRAFINAYIFSRGAVCHKKDLEKISAVREKIELLLNHNCNFSNYSSFYSLLDSENLNVRINRVDLFLIKSFILTKVKTTKSPRSGNRFTKNEYTDIKKLKSVSSIGTAFAELLVKRLRESVSATTVSYLQEIAKVLPFPDPIFDKIGGEYTLDHRKLHCLPCFWGTLIAIYGALREKIPVVLRVQRLCRDENFESLGEKVFFYHATSEGYKACESDFIDQGSPAIVLMGSSCQNKSLFLDSNWEEEVRKSNPVDLLLAYAASHPQYPGKSMQHSAPELKDERFFYYKGKASEWGCCLENPSFFFLAHAYCDTISSVTKEITLSGNSVNMVNTQKTGNC